MGTDRRAEDVLHIPADTLALGSPTSVYLGLQGRSAVGIYGDTVLKCFMYRAELNQSREVEALRRWARFPFVPRTLGSGQSPDGTPWVHMSRVPGEPMDSVDLDIYDHQFIDHLVRLLSQLHWSDAPSHDKQLPSSRCSPVYGHGDFGAHNIIATRPGPEANVSGIIDFEKSTEVCYMADIAAYWANCQTGKGVSWSSFISGYADSTATQLDLSKEHLLVHALIVEDWARRSLDADASGAISKAVVGLHLKGGSDVRDLRASGPDAG